VSSARDLQTLAGQIIACRQCPRLVAWREKVKRDKRRMFIDHDYWGLPVPGFGDRDASLVVVGLAPAAHGANRTGRMFTGDRSGDFLFAALHRRGLASQPTSTAKNDGMKLRGVYITVPCRCAPPDNKPTPLELENCRPFLERELALLRGASVYLALGKTGYDAVIAIARSASGSRFAAPAFGHGVVANVPDPAGRRGEATLVASYHVSQQNTQTGRLTPAMFDRALDLAARRAGL
jgi:uracil-DNA glycosylase family 4